MTLGRINVDEGLVVEALATVTDIVWLSLWVEE
jgi:hypothetical protein